VGGGEAHGPSRGAMERPPGPADCATRAPACSPAVGRLAPRGVLVPLTREEVAQAAFIGTQRNLAALMDARSPAYGAGRAGAWQRHIVGAGGELALARYANRFWSGTVGTVAAPHDVYRWQVRATEYAEGRLTVHRGDPDERPFVLVTGIMPQLCLVGWVLGRAGKRPEWWTNPARSGPARWAFYVPHAALEPLETLPGLRGPALRVAP